MQDIIHLLIHVISRNSFQIHNRIHQIIKSIPPLLTRYPLSDQLVTMLYHLPVQYPESLTHALAQACLATTATTAQVTYVLDVMDERQHGEWALEERSWTGFVGSIGMVPEYA